MCVDLTFAYHAGATQCVRGFESPTCEFFSDGVVVKCPDACKSKISANVVQACNLCGSEKTWFIWIRVNFHGTRHDSLVFCPMCVGVSFCA